MVSCLKEYAHYTYTLCSVPKIDDSDEILKGKMFCDISSCCFPLGVAASALLVSISAFIENDDTDTALTASAVATLAATVLTVTGLTLAAYRKAVRDQNETFAVQVEV